ncbi:MAG: hypothetical protein Kapaf2KO_05930 [Candidatus Kapaibacteriales bacterium]
MALSLVGQRFSTSTIQTQDFPTLKTNFIANDLGANFYTNLVPADFEIIETINNVQYERTATAKVNCKPADEKPEINVLLILDASKSMTVELEGTGRNRFDYVKDAVSAFIDQIEMNGRTAISIMAFGNDPVLSQDWTQDKDLLKQSLNEIEFQNPTRYLPPINGDTYNDGDINAVTRFENRPDDMPNIVIFLTDGDPNDQGIIDELVAGQTFTRGDRAIQDMVDNNITFYSISIFNKVKAFLSKMSQLTNGRDFEIDSPEKIFEVYELLALEIQNSQICELTWESPYSCTEIERDRRVDITLKRNGITSRSQFDAGLQSVADIEVSDKSIFFGNPQPGNFGPRRTLEITPNNLELRIRDMSTQPDTYYKVVEVLVDGTPVTLPTTVGIGQKMEVVIEFIQQTERVFRQADLIADADFCIPITQLVGGIDQVILSYPTGGEIVSLCDELPIQWTGVSAEQPIDISYSLDDGANWNIIRQNATGLEYNWVYPFTTNQDNVRIKLFKKPTESYLWATPVATPSRDSLTSMEISDDGTELYVSGSFENSITFEGAPKNSEGMRDGFVASYSTGGEIIWGLTGGGTGVDEFTGVTKFGNQIYVVGYGRNRFKFGNSQNNSLTPGNDYMFIARLNRDGTVVEQYLLGDMGNFPDFNIRAEGIRVVGNNLEVYGTYTGSYRNNFGAMALGLDQAPTIELNPAANRRGVVLTFRINNIGSLRLQSVLEGARNPVTFKKTEIISSTQLRYNINHIGQNTKYGAYDIEHRGNRDGVITAYGTTPSSEDISEPFKVQRPVLSYDIQNRPVDFTTVPIFLSDSKFFANAIVNNSPLPVVIEDYRFDPANNAFSVVSGLDRANLPITLAPGESLDLEINFSPVERRTFNSSLIIESACANDISLQITGNSTCLTEASEDEIVNPVNVGSSGSTILQGVFTNRNGGQVSITPTLNNTEFNITRIETQNGNLLFDGSVGLGTVAVPAGAILDITVEFTPSAVGNRVAVLDYGVQEGCTDVSTDLTAEGVFAELGISNLHFGIKRQNTVNTGTVTITNQSNGDVSVTNLVLGGNNSPLQFGDGVQTNFNVPVGGNIEIPVEFHPTAEGAYTNTIEVQLNTGSTLTSELSGTGAAPNVTIDFDCPTNSVSGNTYEIAVDLENTTNFDDARILDLSLQQGTEYRLLDGPGGTLVANLTNITIPKNGTQTIYVSYTPVLGSNVNDVMLIEGDFALGNDVDDSYDASVINREDFGCQSAASPELVELEFDVLECYTFNTTLPFANSANSAVQLDIQDLIITGDGNLLAFTGNPTITILSGSTFDIPVSITVPDNNTYSVNIDASDNSLNLNISYDLTMNGKRINIITSDSLYQKRIGDVSTIEVRAEVPSLSHSIEKLDFTLSYAFDVFNSTGQPFNVDGLWTMQMQGDQVYDNGNFTMTYVSTTSPGLILNPDTYTLFSISGDHMLSVNSESFIITKRVNTDCSEELPDFTTGRIVNDDFCETGLRDVLYGAGNNLSSISPNPTSDYLNIEYELGHRGLVEIEILDNAGRVVLECQNEPTDIGVHQYSVDLSGMPSGSYFVSFLIGGKTSIQRLSIQR